MKYKALICDYDGTLSVSKLEGMPSEKVRRFVQKAAKKLHVGIATGRSLIEIKHVFDHLRLSGPSIVNDGAQVVDVNSGKVYREQPLNTDTVEKITRFLHTQKIPFYVMDTKKVYTQNDEYHPRKPFTIVTHGVETEILQKLNKELSQFSDVTYHQVHSWDNSLQGLLIAHSQATKQHGILEVAQILGISTQEIIGVGDGYNDLPLLMACGLKVAMGNAIDDLKAIADYIAPSVEEDGVADVIEKFIL